MTPYIIVRYLHFVSILLLVSTVFTENILISKQLTGKQVGLLAKVDGLYGLASILVLTTGFTLWLWVGKPASFYSYNFLFYIKLGLFTIVGLLSIVPTIFFIQKRKLPVDSLIEIPQKILLVVRIEIFILACIPLFAVVMAMGIGN